MPFDLSIISLKDILDILLVAFILYKTYKVMKSSGSINIFIGILVFIIIWIIVSQVLQMRLLGSIFDKLVSERKEIQRQRQERHYAYRHGMPQHG